MLGKAGEQIRAKMKNKCKPVALDVWLHQEQEKAWHKEREIREIAHQKRQAEREIARQKRQAERAAAAMRWCGRLRLAYGRTRTIGSACSHAHGTLAATLAAW